MKDNRKIIYALLFGMVILIIAVATTPYVESRVAEDANFNRAIKVVLLHEGGLTNDKSDSGGITSYGISLRFIKQEHLDINGDGVVNDEDIIHLTQTEADEIYLKEFWFKYHINKIQPTKIATKVFDVLVNVGPSRTAKLCKQALNQISDDNMAVDGNLNRDLISALNYVEPEVFIGALRYEEEQFYRAIVEKNPHLSVFLKGWLRRVND